jgi:hypothetical protein
MDLPLSGEKVQTAIVHQKRSVARKIAGQLHYKLSQGGFKKE